MIRVREVARCVSRAVLLALLSVPSVARAQSDAIVLVGRVVGAEGRPVASATVSVAALDGVGNAVAQTASDGRYRVVLGGRARAFFLVVRLPGYATQTRQIAGTASDSIIAVDEFRLVRSAQSLSAVRVVAPRAPPVRDPGRLLGKPGESEHRFDAASAFTSTLSGDASGSLEAALSAVPGIAVTTGPGGGAQLTIAGLDASQNRVTVNGADAAPTVPRDGGLLRVSTSGYDPTEAMSGIRADWVIIGANYSPERRIRLTFDAPALGTTGPVASALGQRSVAPILSGVIARPVGKLLRFQKTLFQFSRQAGSLSTLGSVDDAALLALGVNPDSARLVVGALETLGIGSNLSMRSGIHRVTTSGSVLTRLDFTTNSIGSFLPQPNTRVGWYEGGDEGHVLYMIVGVDGSESRGAGAGALTLPAYASNSRSRGVSVQAFNSVYPRPHILNDTRVSGWMRGGRSGPDSPLPAAAVLTAAAVQGGAITTLQAAGSGGATSTTRSWSLEARNDTRWTSRGDRHEWKLALESQVDEISAERGASRGRFEFMSVADFLANRPAAFSRSIAATSTNVRGVHLAAALGDSYSPSRALGWQYGIRFEGHGATADGARNRLVDSLFGVRTGGLPMRFSIAPMAGFTWRYRKASNGFPSNQHRLIGGIRDYRGTLYTRDAQSILGETGLASGMRQLRCIGAATPRPEWERYGDNGAIPSACTDGSDAELAQSALPMSFFSPDFVLGHSVRAEATWATVVSKIWYLNLQAMTAVNTHQPSTIDLNFDGVPRFTLTEEGSRPVFASPGNIGVGSGLSSTVESRRYPQFSHVNSRRSDLRSRSSSVTARLNVYPTITQFGSRTKVPLELSYTLFDTRGQTSGFAGTTAGDPRVAGWEPAASGRHAVLFASVLNIPDWFWLNTGLTLRSGARYTPLVRGDVNADGLSSNDRAFVFDPRTTSDTTLREEMSALFDGAPAHASRCLRRQLARIAAANSCTAPWTAMLNATATIDPARIRLPNRGALNVRVTNILAGLDELVHGSDHLRGWGQPSIPDAVLLQVRGFDPIARRYRYEVNPSFGDTRVYRNLFQSPFRISIDVALDVGPSRERAQIARIVAPDAPDRLTRPDSAALAGRMRGAHDQRNVFQYVIDRAEYYELTKSQIDTLHALGQAHHAFRDSTYDALAGYMAARGAQENDEAIARHWRESIHAVGRFERQIGVQARAVLRPAQVDVIFARGSGPLAWRPIVQDGRELERSLRRWVWMY
jgi:hypothetical protein